MSTKGTQRVISCLVYLIILWCLASCRKSMKAGEYVNYINDRQNGLKKIIQIDGWEYVMQYRPYDYIILMENNELLDDSILNSRENTLKGTAWFNISLKRADGQVSPLRFGISSIDEYNERLDYYLNRAIKDIRLFYGKDTLYPKSYLFENNYNLTPQETMIVGFELNGKDTYPEKDMRLSFTDRIFKNGIINATYSSSALNHIPNLIK